MKTSILIFSFILTLFVNGYGQYRGLIIKNKTNGHEEIIEEGESLKVDCKDGSVFRGKLSLRYDLRLDADSTIMIGNDTLFLKEIKRIKMLPQNTKIIGSALATAGIAVVALGFIIIEGSTDFIFIPLVGLFVTAIGGNMSIAGLLVAVIGKKYSTDKCDLIVL